MEKQNGFSIVELMVAMTLGLVLMAGVVQILTSSQSSYNELVQQARMQEAGKIALDTIVRDLRMVGYWGCNSQYMPVANTVRKDHEAYFDMADSLEGWVVGGEDYDADDFGNTVPVSESDIIGVRIIDVDQSMSVIDHNASSARLPVSQEIHTPKGTIWSVVDNQCQNIAIFAQVNEATNGNNAVSHIVHGTGSGAGGTLPSNCEKALKGNFDCDDTSAKMEQAYADGSSVFRIQHLAYLVAPSNQNDNINSLYRKTLDLSNDSEPVIDGVNSLTFSYGLDLNGDNVVDLFASADAIRTNTSYAFSQVISIAIEIEVVSLEDVGLEAQTFSTSVRLRNRGLS